MKATTKADKIKAWALTIFLTGVSLAWAMPIVIVLINSFKSKGSIATETFKMPTAETFVGLQNFTNGITAGNYNFWKCVGYSVIITVLSVSLILVCTSMAAWYITRVNSKFAKLVYTLCTFSMIVPFQMVQYTLSNTANMLHLDTPYTIPIIYLGFGAGMAIFMFTGFIKQIPLEIEEAAVVDGCSPVQTFFKVVLPMLAPSMISVGILEAMWVWNDYLLPYLVLDITKYRTIPIHIQYLRGSYGSVDMGASMALIILALLPVIIIYLFCQKYIIKGVAAGAVKG
ncbi:MAG: carbohydrate ABC transporter permease [Erysipelotrichaceae bacterium]|nr:carbohydrate ABC transporter permease [Erysipelotrichaceae bacterium]